jgi:type I restriction enzyme M protein
MAIKKSDLYSSIWASCDELRGGMDAGQYKDYVLFMLFIKYVSDKYAHYDGFEPPIIIPKRNRRGNHQQRPKDHHPRAA